MGDSIVYGSAIIRRQRRNAEIDGTGAGSVRRQGWNGLRVWNVDHPAPKTKGIWTTDWSGASGYNRGGPNPAGDEKGNYTDSFGGTSCAAPGVAGVAALVLSLNPELPHDEVKDILRRACHPVDQANGNYDGVTGHSPLYGYGRVNAATAVAVAAPIGKTVAKRKGGRRTATRKAPAARKTHMARKKR